MATLSTEPQRAKTVPTTLADVKAAATRVFETAGALEDALLNGLRSAPMTAEPKKEADNKTCFYHGELLDTAEILGNANDRLQSILERLEV